MGPISSVEPASAQRVEIVLSQLGDLPSLPAVATRLLQLTSDDQADVREIIRLIETDPPLAAKVLSMIGKASVGAGAGAKTVERAVLLLGMDTIRNLVLAVEVLSVFRSGERPPGEEPTFQRPEFWKHCLAVGCAAELLAVHTRPRVNPHEAFICGLLHDLGKIALFTVMPKSYERVVRTTMSRRASLADVEREIIGVDHTIAGKRVAQQWQLPDSITACLWLHHHPPEALPESVAQAELVRTVYLANVLAREMRLGQSGNYAFSEPSVQLAATLGIDQPAHAQVVRELVGRIEQHAELIDVRELSSEGLYLEALGRANRELVGLNASLAARNRDLETRSRLLEACGAFAKSLSATDTPAKICQSAAGALHGILPAEAVVVCSAPDAEGVYHLGVCAGAEPASQSYLLTSAKASRGAAADRPERSTPVPAQPSPHPLPRECLAKARDLLGGPPQDMSTISYAKRVVGALFSRAAKGGEAALGAAVAEAAPLVSAVGVALSSARTRAAAERLAEDLSEANRRLHESQHLLLRQRTLNMISEMAGGAAHELNNPLAVISGRAQMLSADTPPERIEAVAKIIKEQAHRCSAIVMELLQFARPRKPRPELHEVAALLNEVREEFLRRGSLESENFVLDVSDAGLRVYADREQILRALNELLANGLQATSEAPPRLHVNCYGNPVDEQVVIALRDHGQGMSAEVLQRAFDPFYSDRPAGRGRGLGLCHAYRMVEINGGRLRLESSPGQGTTAWISLPGKPAATPLP